MLIIPEGAGLDQWWRLCASNRSVGSLNPSETLLSPWATPFTPPAPGAPYQSWPCALTPDHFQRGICERSVSLYCTNVCVWNNELKADCVISPCYARFLFIYFWLCEKFSPLKSLWRSHSHIYLMFSKYTVYIYPVPVNIFLYAYRTFFINSVNYQLASMS